MEGPAPHHCFPRRRAVSPLSRQATFLVACLTLQVFAAAEGQPAPTAPRPDYPVLHDSPSHRGVPLGGVGCGAVCIRPDGSIGDITINNNWSHPVREAPGCFAGIWTSAGSTTTALSLRLTDPYRLPAVEHIDFAALYPQARLAYSDQALPVSVSCRAISPALPYDDRASTLPVAMFVFTVTNQARGPLDAAIAVSWENLLGVGGTGTTGAFADRTGSSVEEEPVSDRVLGLHFLPPPLPGTSAPNRLRYNARGDYALLVERGADERDTTLASWNSLDSTPTWWSRFAREGRVEGAVGEAKEGQVHTAGVLAIRFRMKPGETREVPFALAWHTPRLYAMDGKEYGHYYERSFQDAVSVARYCLVNRRTLTALTDEWQSFLMRSSLPAWLSHAFLASLSRITTHTVLSRDSGDETGGPAILALLTDPIGRPGATATGMAYLEAMVSIAALAPQFIEAGLRALVAEFPQSPSLARLIRNTELSLTPQPVPGRRADFDDAVALGCLMRMLGPSGAQSTEVLASRGALDRAAATYRAADPALEALCRLATGGSGSGVNMTAGSADGEAYEAMVTLGGLPVALQPPTPPTRPVWSAVSLIRQGKVSQALSLLKYLEETDQAADSPGLLLVLHALAGVSHDPAEGRLTMAPRQIDGVPVTAYPVVGGSWWAWIERRQTIGSIEIRLRLVRVLPRKTVGPQAPAQDLPGLAIRQVVLPEMAPGQWAELSLNRDALDVTAVPGGDPRVVTLGKPITLTSGQTLVAVIRTGKPTAGPPG